MGVDGAVDALALHARACGGEDLVAGSAGADLVHHDVLQRVRIGERAACSPAGASRLTRLEHVGVVLGIGVEARHRDADVAVQQIAALDDRIVAELLGGRALPLHFDARLEPRSEPEIVDPLSPPPDEVARPRLARA